MVSILYFAHDLWDTAVERRVEMLRQGGATVTVVGFRRRAPARATMLGDPVIDLGLVGDGALGRRAAAILLKGLSAASWAKRLAPPDVIMARSLELLTLAAIYKAVRGVRANLVYECLDIHRLMFSKGFAGKVLRALERRLLGGCTLVLTSSPAFAEQHFARVQGRLRGVRLLENKLALGVGAAAGRTRPDHSPPWRIGWFGMIRCAKSLAILEALCKAAPGKVEVLIAGRVAQSEFADFDARIAGSGGVRFLGPYEPAELEQLYSQVHFVWAIDFFEEGLNSAWLLPNRIYEGCAFGAVPIALRTTETGRWLMQHNVGLILEAADSRLLAERLEGVSAAAYGAFADQVAALPASAVRTTPEDCLALVDLMRAAAAGSVQ